MSFPARRTGGGGGTGGDIHLNSRSAVMLLNNNYLLPLGGWTKVPFTILAGGAGFAFDISENRLGLLESGLLIINARVGAQPAVENAGRLRLTVMIMKNGEPVTQAIGSALHNDAMCAATATVVDYFQAGDYLEAWVIGDGAEWTSLSMVIPQDRALNSMDIAYLLPEVVV